MGELIKQFDKDFRGYLDGSVNYFNLTGKALSSEDEIKWIKDWIENNCKPKDK